MCILNGQEFTFSLRDWIGEYRNLKVEAWTDVILDPPLESYEKSLTRDYVKQLKAQRNEKERSIN